MTTLFVGHPATGSI